MESYVRYSVPFNIDKNENDCNDMETLTLRFFLYLMCSERKGNS